VITFICASWLAQSETRGACDGPGGATIGSLGPSQKPQVILWLVMKLVARPKELGSVTILGVDVSAPQKSIRYIRGYMYCLELRLRVRQLYP
jgi:hypothetical protein